MGGAAHRSGGDGVQLIVEAIGGGIGGAGAAGQEHAADGRADAAPHVDQHQVFLHVDAGHPGGAVIAADGEHVTAKAGLGEENGREDEHNDENDHDHGDPQDIPFAEEAEVVAQAGNRDAGVHLGCGTQDELSTQGGDEGRDLGIGDDGTNDESDDRADGDADQENKPARQRAEAQDLAGGIGGLGQRGADDGDEGHRGTGRQIDALGQYGEHDAKGQDALDGLGGDQSLKVARRQKDGLDDGHNSNDHNEDQPDAVF